MGSSVDGSDGWALPKSLGLTTLARRQGVSPVVVGGTESIAAVREVGHTGWFIVYYQDRASFLGGLEDANRRILLVLIALMIGGAVGMGVFWLRKQSAVHASSERLTELVANVNDAVMVVHDGRVVYASPGIETMLGLSPADACGRELAGVVGASAAPVLAQLISATDGRHRPISVGDVPCSTHSGRTVWVEATVADRTHSKSIHGIVVSLHDIDQRKRSSEELMRAATHDLLTGLPNRANFAAAFERVTTRSRRSQILFGVLYLDLDGFKAVNDRHGHTAGDHVLIEVASRLSAVVRPGDVVARFGGDEFAILLDNLNDVREAELVARRIIERINAEISFGSQQLRVGVSLGIVLGDGTEPYEAVVRNADLTMYDAKESGKNAYRVFASASARSGEPALPTQRRDRESTGAAPLASE